MLLEEKDGRLVGTSPSAGHPVSRSGLCARGWNVVEATHHVDRLARPLVREGGGLVETGWERAVEEVAHRLEPLRRPAGSPAGTSRVLFVVGPTVANEDVLAIKRLASGLGAAVCATDVGGAAAARRALGTVLGRASLPLDSTALSKADLVWSFCADADAVPQVASRLVEAEQAGAQSVRFDCMLAPRHPQTTVVDIPPGALPYLPLVLQEAALAADRVPQEAKSAEGYTAFADAWRPTSSPRLPDHPWLTSGLAQELCRAFTAAKRPAVVLGSRWLEQPHAADLTTQLIQALALLGGACMTVVAGESNTAGVLDVLGEGPGSQDAWLDLLEPGNARAFDALVVVGDDIVARTPRPAVLREKIAKLPTLVVVDAFRSATSGLAHVVLPSCAFGELDGTVTSGFGHVQRWRAVRPPPGDAAPERVWAQRLGACLGLPSGPSTLKEWLTALGREVPRYRDMDLVALAAEDAPYGLPVPEKSVLRFTPPVLPAPPAPAPGFPLQLIPVPHPAHWSTGALSERNHLLRREAGASVLHANGADLRAAEVRPGWTATLVTPWGEAPVVVDEDPRAMPGVPWLTALPGTPAAALRGFFPDTSRTSLGTQPVPARLQRS
jgi:anaerobic selenocysteine-containing dehydrogenase